MCSEVRATLRANWNESLEEASERKILVKKTEEIELEVSLANKALVMVRPLISTPWQSTVLCYFAINEPTIHEPR